MVHGIKESAIFAKFYTAQQTCIIPKQSKGMYHQKDFETLQGITR